MDDLVTANEDNGFVIFNVFPSVFKDKFSHTFVLRNRVQRGEYFDFTKDKTC